MKKIGLIILVAILALGAMGAAFAAWTQSLSITGNVTTGNLAATISHGILTSSVTYATIADGAGASSTALVIDIGNCAPGNVFTIPWTITNTGSIPINMSAPTVTITPPSGGAAADLTVAGAPGAITTLAAAGTSTGSMTITVNSSLPNTNGKVYTISVPMTVTQ